MENYHTSSPILFIIFNRPDLTRRVFEKIRDARPLKLYVAADGAREGKMEEMLCEETRKIIDEVDWPCEVFRLFLTENAGCKYGPANAISWFFSNEEHGIILEDDCLPSIDFFRFCDVLLEKYANDHRITQIAGCNVQANRKQQKDTYYFSHNVEVWGWASWKRVWKNYDIELQNYFEEEIENQIFKLFSDNNLAVSFKNLFKDIKSGKISDAWDYQFKFLNFFNYGLCIIPNYNLISNIGFGAGATHTFDPEDQYANIAIDELPLTISHPKYFIPDKKADLYTLYKDFGLDKSEKSPMSKAWKKLKKLFRN